MKKLKAALSILACRLVRFGLRMLGRGGTALPGKVALKICPDILQVLARNVKTVVITGTNGKTTSSRMVEQMLAEAGLKYFANRSGANLIQGITAEFAAHATITGKAKCGCAVIECDEGASKQVCGYINPAVVLVTNIFGDQLDRFGDVMTTLEKVKAGVKNSPEAVICLNADCSLSASIAREIENPVIFYGVETEIYRERVSENSDAAHCVFCRARYEYDYVTYGHLGGFKCPRCGYSRPEPRVAVKKILRQDAEGTTVEMLVDGQPLVTDIGIPGGFNIYNAAAAMAVALALGIPKETAARALAGVQSGFGRMEKLTLGGVSARMILVKNPAGCNQVLNFLASMEEEAIFVICLNDNVGDGRDVSWIWDAGFEILPAMSGRLSKVIASGIRADEMALRLKYAGLPQEMMEVIPDYDMLIEAMTGQDRPVIIMPTYSAMMELREKIASKFGLKEFWE
jgi:UDP-N-acetylmuramyl tripeptide synthase